MAEDSDVDRILKVLKEVGGIWFKTPRSPFIHAGTPDIIGCLCGWFIGIEVKRFKKKQGYGITPTQKYRLGLLSQEGAGVALIDSEKALASFLDVLRRFRDANMAG